MISIPHTSGQGGVVQFLFDNGWLVSIVTSPKSQTIEILATQEVGIARGKLRQTLVCPAAAGASEAVEFLAMIANKPASLSSGGPRS